jgi:hypothetical protein
MKFFNHHYFLLEKKLCQKLLPKCKRQPEIIIFTNNELDIDSALFRRHQFSETNSHIKPICFCIPTNLLTLIYNGV